MLRIYSIVLLFCSAILLGRSLDDSGHTSFVPRAEVISVQENKNRLCAQAGEIPPLRGKNESEIRRFFFERERPLLLATDGGLKIGTFEIDRLDMKGRGIQICGTYSVDDDIENRVLVGLKLGVDRKSDSYVSKAEGEPAAIKPAGRIRHHVDRKTMLLVPWDFIAFGQAEDPNADNYNPHFFERDPKFTPRIESFYMDEFEVTNQEYLFFCKHSGHELPEVWKETGTYETGTGEHPFAYASFSDAQAYASWTGKQVPDELEWELAARGGLKLLRNGSGPAGIKRTPKSYPIGDWSPNVCNTIEMWAGKEPHTIPVRELRDKSPYGIVGLCGSVKEWTTSWYNPYPGSLNFPTNLSGKQFRVLRGGSFSQDKTAARSDHRDYGGFETPSLDHNGGIRLILRRALNRDQKDQVPQE